MIDEAKPISTTQVSDSIRTSCDRLCATLLPVCWVFDEIFQELFEGLQVSGDYIRGRDSLVFWTHNITLDVERARIARSMTTCSWGT